MQLGILSQMNLPASYTSVMSEINSVICPRFNNIFYVRRSNDEEDE